VSHVFQELKSWTYFDHSAAEESAGKNSKFRFTKLVDFTLGQAA